MIDFANSYLKESTWMSSKIKDIKQLFYLWQNNTKFWCVATSQTNLKKRTILYFLHLFFKSGHKRFCGDSLTIAQRKPLGHHIYQKKSWPSTSKWSSSAENSDANKNIVKNALLHWKEYDPSKSKEPNEANIYASLHQYLKWFHVIQEKVNKFIQENAPRKDTTPDYVHRNYEIHWRCLQSEC